MTLKRALAVATMAAALAAPLPDAPLHQRLPPSTPMSAAQRKRRAAGKRARKARKINRKHH